MRLTIHTWVGRVPKGLLTFRNKKDAGKVMESMDSLIEIQFRFETVLCILEGQCSECRLRLSDKKSIEITKAALLIDGGTRFVAGIRGLDTAKNTIFDVAWRGMFSQRALNMKGV